MRIGLLAYRRARAPTEHEWKTFGELHFNPRSSWASIILPGPVPVLPLGRWSAAFEPEEAIDPPFLNGDIMTSTHKQAEHPRFVGRIFSLMQEDTGEFWRYGGTIEMIPMLGPGRHILPVFLDDFNGEDHT